MLEPWREVQREPDQIKRSVYQQQEEAKAGSLPLVLKQFADAADGDGYG
jgi:hypothetical protein